MICPGIRRRIFPGVAVTGVSYVRGTRVWHRVWDVEPQCHQKMCIAS